MRRQRLLVLAVGVVVASTLITPFTRELFVGDETKYSKVIREMRATGAWFLPTLEGTPFTHKPPLHFWIVDLLSYPFGVHSIWPFVLPSLLTFVALLWAVSRMSRDMMGGADATSRDDAVAGIDADALGALTAAFVCGSSLLVWGSAQSARMDVSFTLLLTLAAWMMFRAFERNDPRGLAIAGVLLGIATLVKGPMAPVIAIVLFAIEWWRRRRAPRRGWFTALVAMIVIPLLWFVPAMILGGRSYTQDVLEKQMANRALSAWVHRSPPWYYLEHAPAFLFPWFLLLVVALIALYRRHSASEGAKFCVSWIVAVVLPYSIVSSKLDVYMMALIPPVALLIGDFVGPGMQDDWAAWGRGLNAFMLAFFVMLGTAGILVSPSRFKGPESAYLRTLSVRGLFGVLIGAAIISMFFVMRSRTLFVSTIAVGLVPIAAFVYAAVVLMPIVNEIASTKPLIRTLEGQHVSGDAIALYTSPHLWSRDMPRDLERVHYVSPADLANGGFRPEVIVTSRSHASEIASALSPYRRVAEVRMIGKWFDVYRR